MQVLFPELRSIFEPFTHTPSENVFLIHSSNLAWTQSSVTHLKLFSVRNIYIYLAWYWLKIILLLVVYVR